jgi:hypothetical protein
MSFPDICEVIGVCIMFVAALVAAGSLVALWRQTRENAYQTRMSSRAAQASAYNNLAQSMLDIDRIFFDNPELRPFFYEDCAVPTDARLFARVNILAEMMVDFMDNAMVQGSLLEGYEWTEWESYFCDMYRTSPAIRDFWHTNRHWYSELLGDILDPLPAGVSSSDAASLDD